MAQAYEELAREWAQHASEHHFDVRRRFWTLRSSEPDERGLVIYTDNHPYANFPERRAQEIEAMREWLSARGFPVLAEASYPPAGEAGAGYTLALVIRTDPEFEAVPNLLRMMDAALGDDVAELN